MITPFTERYPDLIPDRFFLRNKTMPVPVLT